MKFFKKSTVIGILCIALVGTSQESMPSELSENKTLNYRSNFLYGSLSIAPGAGFSFRTRNDSTGTALDLKAGFFPFGPRYPIPSIDYNILYYTRANETSSYCSCGIGAFCILPYIPLRAGIEFKHGFVDIGAKVLLYPAIIPSPEIRGGIGIDF